VLLNPAWALAVALGVQPPTPQSSSRPADHPITHFFQNLGHDVAALPSPLTGVFLAIGAGGTVSVHPADSRVYTWAARQPASGLASFGNTMGDALVQGGAALATWAIGELSHDAFVTHLGSDLIRAQALNGLIVTPTKYLVNRTRPDGGRHSFPSGHASATFATATVLAEHFGWKGAVPGYTLATIVAWARVRSNHHWLSDVVAGSAIGLLSGTTVTAGHRKQWTVVPAPAPGGAAVFVVRRLP
jgi:membrane-associated phospholipid phosphatase